MTIEEKARAYDEALNKARKVYEGYKQQLDAIEDKKSNAALLLTGGITTLECQFPELKESDDEKIRKEIKAFIKSRGSQITQSKTDGWLAWLEKQGEHANFCNKIQIGDKVTRNEDGVLVNLSQLKRVAKKDEKQGEQKKSYDTCDFSMMDNKKSPYGEKRDFGYFEEKPTDKVEPKFHKGEWVAIKE